MARGLSDAQLGALVESLPEGMGMYDEAAAPVWMNREARRLMSLRSTWDPGDNEGTELGKLIPRLVAALSTTRLEQHARCTVEGDEVVRIVLRRDWGSHTSVWLHGSRAVESGSLREEVGGASPLSPGQLIVADRMLEEAVIGLAVADDYGQICWMNRQAWRLLRCGPRTSTGAEKNVGRAARHVASGNLVAPVRLHLQLQARGLDALFWNAGPRLAGVLLHEEQARWLRRPERPAA
jgi:PAS domain-containing protein